MTDASGVVHSATNAAGIIAEIEALKPSGDDFIVPTRTPEDDAHFVEALRLAEHPVTRENLLTLVRELLIPAAVDAVLPQLSDDNPEVRGEAADTLGTLIAYAPATPSPAQRDAALGTLLDRWDVETDDMVRSCLLYALVGFREHRLRRIFEGCSHDIDGRVRLQGQSGLDHLDAPDPAVLARHEGEVAAEHPPYFAETLHRRCCVSDPYGRTVHPPRRDIRGVLLHGDRERSTEDDTLIIHGRHFDLVLKADSPAGWVIRVTDPEGMPECRQRSDHKYRVRLQPLSPAFDASELKAARRSDMFHATPSGLNYVRDYHTADEVLDGIANKPDGSWFVIEPRTRESDSAFVEALRRVNENHGPETAELRGILCHILAEFKTPDAVDPVTDALTDPDPTVRYEAVRALDRIIGDVPNPPPPDRTRRARQALTDLWHGDIDDDLRSTLAGALTAFDDPDLRPLLAEHRDSHDPRTRRLCRGGIRHLDQYDPATRRKYTGPALQGSAAGYDDEDLAFLLHRDVADGDPYGERPHPREKDILKTLRWGGRERVPGENVVRITGRHIVVTIDEDAPSRWGVAFIDPTEPGLPPCRLPWHRRVSTGFSATAIGTDGQIVSGPNNTGREPKSG